MNPAELEHRIFNKLRMKVPIREVNYQAKRVVVFQVPTDSPESRGAGRSDHSRNLPRPSRVRSPGEPLVEIERFVDETRARAPDLAEIMRLARICEVRGSGVDRALEQIEDYLQPAPRFQSETAATRVTLLRERKFEDMTQEERIWSALLHCCVKYEKSDRLTNASLRARHELTAAKTTIVSQAIAATVEGGLIKLDPRAGSSKRHAA